MLPSPSTLKSWYRVIHGSPGFTDEAFIHLKNMAAEKEKKLEKVVCNLCVDEISIKPSAEFVNGKSYGYQFVGTQSTSTDGRELASHIQTFMLVAFNGAWKIPIGYFPLHALSGTEIGELLKTCLELILFPNVIVRSITSNGALANKSMCKLLGANFDYYSPADSKPWIEHPVTKERVLLFWDPCHMLQLTRNALGEKDLFFQRLLYAWRKN